GGGVADRVGVRAVDGMASPSIRPRVASLSARGASARTAFADRGVRPSLIASYLCFTAATDSSAGFPECTNKEKMNGQFVEPVGNSGAGRGGRPVGGGDLQRA